ncbi:MAG TPA: O-antigen ligase family protein [bacterium]|nr:O-antigen ligase family protein [bacterium]
MFDNDSVSVSPKHVNIIFWLVVCLFVLNFIVQNFMGGADYDLNSSMMFGAFALIVLGLLVTFFNFQLSYILFIFVIPWVKLSIPNMKFFFTVGDAYLIILIVILFGRLITGREKRPISSFLDKLIFFFIFMSLVSFAGSRNLAKGMAEITQTLEYFVFCYYLSLIVISKKNILDSLIQALIMSSILLSLYSIYQYVSLGGGEIRIYGPIGHFNGTGTYHAMMIPFIFNLAVGRKEQRAKLFYYLALALNIIVIGLTFSRGAWIGTIVGIVLSAQIRGMVQFLKVFSLIILGLLLLAFIAPPRYIGRIYSIPRIEDTSSKNHLRQYEIAYETLTTYPLFGVGLANNSYHVIEKYDEASNGEIHNLYLHIGSERGILAMCFLLMILGSFYINIIRRIGKTTNTYYHSIYVALFSTMVSYGMANIFAYQLIRGLGLLFAVFLAMYPATIYIEDNEPASAEWAEMLSTLDIRHTPLEMGL